VDIYFIIFCRICKLFLLSWNTVLPVPNDVSLNLILLLYRALLLQVLPTVLAAHHWRALREQVFFSPDVALIGYGVRGDLKLLAKSWPTLFGGVHTDSRGVVSLELLKARLAVTLQLPAVAAKGLSGLTAAVLGRPLQKGGVCEIFANPRGRNFLRKN
jgi:hypothetical protein